jgi:hypothetical protein
MHLAHLQGQVDRQTGTNHDRMCIGDDCLSIGGGYSDTVGICKLVNEATLSLLSVASTEITLCRQAGEAIAVPELALPDEANVTTPRARNVLIAAAPAMFQDVELSQLPAKVAFVTRLILIICTSGR